MRLDHVSYVTSHDQLADTVQRLGSRLGTTFVDGGIHPRFGTRNFTAPLLDGKYASNTLDSGAIIDCLDWTDARTIEETKADAARFDIAAPIFGPYLAYTNIACKYLTPPTKDKLTRPTNKITSIKTAPIIVIGTTGDPATPYEWAVGLSKIFTSSKLITLNADGHTGQGRGSACVDDAVDAYLLEGKSPKKNLNCTL